MRFYILTFILFTNISLFSVSLYTNTYKYRADTNYKMVMGMIESNQNDTIISSNLVICRDLYIKHMLNDDKKLNTKVNESNIIKVLKTQQKYINIDEHIKHILKNKRYWRVNYDLIIKIIMNESTKKIYKKSHKSAYGLMQITKICFNHFTNVHRNLKYTWSECKYNYRVNLHIGIWYLSFLFSYFNERYTVPKYYKAVSSYFWGTGNVKKYGYGDLYCTRVFNKKIKHNGDIK